MEHPALLTPLRRRSGHGGGNSRAVRGQFGQKGARAEGGERRGIDLERRLRATDAAGAVFVATLALSATTFLCIVVALTRAMGDAGKAVAMIFLAVQLSSSGGILPVELSGSLFSGISPWLPLTWVVRAMKISLFDAYGGEWQHPMTVIALTCLAALLCASRQRINGVLRQLQAMGVLGGSHGRIEVLLPAKLADVASGKLVLDTSGG